MFTIPSLQRTHTIQSAHIFIHSTIIASSPPMVNLYAIAVHVQESVYDQKLRHQQYSLSFVVASPQCSSQAHAVCSHIICPPSYVCTISILKYSSLIIIIKCHSFLEGEIFVARGSRNKLSDDYIMIASPTPLW